MTRRARNTTPKTAFKGLTGSLVNAVDKLKDRMLATIPNELTYQDLVELFVPPECHEFAIGAPMLYDVGSRYNRLRTKWWTPYEELGRQDGRWLNVTFNPNDDKYPLLPRVGVVQETASAATKEKVTSWVMHRHQIGKDFGRLTAVLDQLNNACATPAQMRFFLPGVLALCSLNPSLEGIAAEIQSHAEPNKIPTLPAELRRACPLAGGTIAVAQLLDEAVELKEAVALTLENVLVQDATGFRYTTV